MAIARSLVNRPPLLLADEPTGNLDSKTGTEIMNIFQNLHQSGTTLVLVTHDPEVAKWSERVVSMRDGRVERDTGNPRRMPAPAAGPSMGHGHWREEA